METTANALHWRSQARLTDLDSDDKLADVIARLSAEEAERLWSVVIQLKPHLNE